MITINFKKGRAMKKLVFTLLVLILAVPVINAQWTLYNTGVPYSLFAVDFSPADENLGIAVGQGGTIIKTTDGGDEWIPVFAQVDIWLNDIKWQNTTTVWAAGMGGVILKSDDAGWNWSVVRPFSTPDHTIRGIGIPDGVNYVAFVGYAGTYFETFNGGATFTQRYDIPYTMHSIDFAPDYALNGRAIISGTDGLVWNTTNSGATWVSRNSGRFDYLNDVVFIDNNIAMICGNNGTIIRSTNWGRTWTANTQYLTVEHLRSIDNWGSLGSGKITVCGDNGKIMTSNNDGLTFIDQLGGETRHLYGVSLRSANQGTVVGEIGNAASGAMYVTMSNGFTDISQNGTGIPSKYKLEQNYPNPFNPSTKISFAMPKSGMAKLTVFDLTGKEVATLVNDRLSAGSYTYEFNASKLSSGVYFYRLITNDFVETKKMTLIK